MKFEPCILKRQGKSANGSTFLPPYLEIRAYLSKRCAHNIDGRHKVGQLLVLAFELCPQQKYPSPGIAAEGTLHVMRIFVFISLTGHRRTTKTPEE